ncbi:MAG TPA: argininosuccinate lyase, partial [Candidatus Lustribacter sp.]
MASTEEQPALQWGGRFAVAPDAALIAFGSSLEDDLVLAPFDVRCSRAHVIALAGGRLLSGVAAGELHAALDVVAEEIAAGTFTAFARAGAFEDIHGAIDARVRELAPDAGASLHAGRSRNDQVATTLLLYACDRAHTGGRLALAIAHAFENRARGALEDGTLLAATTHWQPAQPVSLAFWLDAAAQGFVRAAMRFARVALDAARFCPLGSAALAGSSLPLDRVAAARELGFVEPSRNALDTVGDRDVALDLLHAAARAAVAASRPSEEFVLWTTPAFGYARLGDAAATGSSLMPQKKNPDPFELVRAAAARTLGTYTGALASASGIGLSYHRDLQETKAQIVHGTEHALAALDAFARAFSHLQFDAAAMEARAAAGYTVATDLADAMIA